MLYKFTKDDIFVNYLETHPACFVHVSSGSLVTNFADEGFGDDVSLETLDLGEDHYNFVFKDGNRNVPKTIGSSSYDSSYQLGDVVTSSLPLTSSISVSFAEEDGTGIDTARLRALRNTFDYYTVLSPHYAFSSSYGDKLTQGYAMVNIPGIFYGSQIEKGSVDMSFWSSGSLIARLEDVNRNGELIQTEGADGSGSVAGVVLYNEGIIHLTGSWDLHTASQGEFKAYSEPASDYPKWIYWGSMSMQDEEFYSCQLRFNGTETIPKLTMFAHAPKGELNHSNNPSFVSSSLEAFPSYSTSSDETGNQVYEEPTQIALANTIQSPHSYASASFERQTFISKVAIYDEDGDMIAIASLAEPIKKLEERDYTFKITLDA